MDMPWYREVWRIINGQRTTTGRTKDGIYRVNSESSFKPLSLDRQAAVNAHIEAYQNSKAAQVLGEDYSTLADIRERTDNRIPPILDNYVPGKKDILTRVQDSWGQGRDITPVPSGGRGGISNTRSNAGIFGQDPSMSNRVNPNVWISPMEAATIYSQKGLPETILRKKSQSILLNGVRIRCRGNLLTPEHYDRLDMGMQKTGLAHRIAEVINMSLGYGGGMLYPMFKRDSPMSMGLPISTLAKYGIVGKNCIERYVPLDRWNVVHIPSWNPTAEDWLNPKFYYVPFLGADVSRERCARIVTAPQNGYWGNLMTLGWGLPDSAGWIEAIYDYMNVLKTAPNMINQMSMLVRTINADGVLATEGSEAMRMLAEETTSVMREASVNNPIQMDVIGKLEAINRDFKQVPELVRLIRQHAAALANIPEELLWSSERGAFASGDSNDSAYEKQSEGTRYIHIDVANQLKPIAQLEVINTLGLDREILKALPYVYIEFDNPRVTNAMDKAKIGSLVTKGIFDASASRLPLPLAVKIGEQFADDEFHVSSEQMQDLEKRQKIQDDRDKEEHDKNMELLDAQIAGAKAGPVAPAGKPAGKKSDKKGHSYADPMEQKQHEKVGGANRQGIQKAQNKGA